MTTIYIEWWGNRPVARPLLWRVAGAVGPGRAPMGGMRRLAVQERAIGCEGALVCREVRCDKRSTAAGENFAKQGKLG